MPIIQVNHVTKEYRLGQIQSLKTTTLNQWRRLTGQPVEERAPFKALNDVSFSVEQGEVLGIIGHNGAGKSTMLKLLANISKPSSGSIAIKGKIAPLIEVGAGLVPDLTGRENIYLNGAILGIAKKEIERKFDEIVAFAELEEFIDTPIKRYSSGMSVRLGFAIATSVESDILIVDEVLSVGDLAFQRKCFDRMEDLIKRQRRTVLLVSHNIRQVERLCSRVVLLDQGKVLADGKPRDTCNLFYERSDEKIKNSQMTPTNKGKRRYETGGDIELATVSMFGEDGRQTDSVAYKEDVRVVIKYRINRPLSAPVFGVGVHTTDFLYLATSQSMQQLALSVVEPGNYEVTCIIKEFPFLPGIYSLRVGVALGEMFIPAFYAENVLHFQVIGKDLSRACVSNDKEGFVALETSWALDEMEVDRNG